ncbi:MAG: DNA-binding protein, partial [Lysobacter sp.]
MPVGVPEGEVFAAADRVLARGERPTTERVRAELGRGSPARVGQLLEQWWDALSKRLAGESRLPELPAEVAAAFKSVWASASAHGRQDAEAALAERQAQLQAEQAVLNEARARDAAEIAIAEQLQREANLARAAVEARLA